MPQPIVLRNLAAGAPWASRFFRLDRSTGIATGFRTLGPSEHVVGIGSRLLARSDGHCAVTLLGIYVEQAEWIFLDGEQHVRIENVTASWNAGPSLLGGLGLASLKVKLPTSTKSMTYLRPWLRHWFEGGWTLSDIDIACVSPQLLTDEAARTRLLRALDDI